MKIPHPDAKRAKTETLSLRLDPKTRFMLDIVSRIKGQSITIIVERAIHDAADSTNISVETDSYGNVTRSTTWKDYWSPVEGVRLLNLLIEEDYRKSFEEEEILYFCKYHWQFFFTDQRKITIKDGFVDILWPKVRDYVELWKEQKKSNNWIAGEAMKTDLNAAKIKPPEWPPVAKDRTHLGIGLKGGGYGDLDDDIPF